MTVSGIHLIPIGAGLVSALLHLSTLTGSPGALLLTYFAQLPLAATGFALGAMPAAVAAAVATLIVGIALPAVGALTQFLLLSALPTILIVYLALQNRTAADGTIQWYPPGRILAWLTMIGIGAILAAALAFSTVEGGLQGELQRYFVSVLSAFGTMDTETAEGVAANAVPLLPGILAAYWLIMNVVNAVLALRLVTAAGRNLRPPPSFRETDIPIWPHIAFALGVLLTFFGGFPAFFGKSMMIVAAVPFLFIGLAVLHSISAAWPGRILMLSGVYLSMVLLQFPAAIVALLGIAENWLRLREKARARHTKGNE